MVEKIPEPTHDPFLSPSAIRLLYRPGSSKLASYQAASKSVDVEVWRFFQVRHRRLARIGTGLAARGVLLC
jgi:hypothetical protein